MPPDTVKVDRTTKWGNPFVIGADGTREECIALFRRMVGGGKATGRAAEQRAYLAMMKADLGELRGKTLACWCSLPEEEGAPDLCHAAILIGAANR